MPTPDEIIRRRSALVPGLVADRFSDQSIAERGLRRMGTLLNRLDNPQYAYRTIHIAGSKGKGTTTYLTAALLTALGYTTGRYISPHILSWNERIAVDRASIPDQDFARFLSTIDRSMAEIEEQQPEFGPFNAFELITASAFVYFRKCGCDFAVIEVGLGGRFDSTNHLRPAACAITRIEEEHIDVLGPTLREVAWNKAGIIRPNTPVVVESQRSIADSIIADEANLMGAPLLREGREWTITRDDGLQFHMDKSSDIAFASPLPGAHNRSNIGAALAAVWTATADKPLTGSAITEALAGIRIPGRFDRRIDPHTGRALILDGAHTLESVGALVDTVRHAGGPPALPVILGVLSDKPADDILAALAPITEQVVFPELANPRAIDANALATMASRLGIRAATAPNVRAAIDAIGPGLEPVLVTGSFGVVAEALIAIGVRDLSGE